MKLAIILTLTAVSSFAQTVPRSTVTASGQATVSAQPDQAKIDVNVVTQGATAQEASASNATQVTAVTAALSKLLGAAGDIKTVNYFVGPVYKNSTTGPPVIAGFSASSTVQVTIRNLTFAGAVIDTATQAGATSVGGLRFELQNSEPLKLQALRMATVQAKTHADAIASGLGRTTGAVLTVLEGGGPSIGPIIATGIAAPTTSTPVTPGLIDVQASVAMTVELN